MPLPLAYSPLPCVYGQVGIDALERAGIDRHKAFRLHSVHDLRAAVLSGLALAMFMSDDLRPGMVLLDERDGLSPLSMMDYVLVYNHESLQDSRAAVRELGRLIEQAEWASQDVAAKGLQRGLMAR